MRRPAAEIEPSSSIPCNRSALPRPKVRPESKCRRRLSRGSLVMQVSCVDSVTLPGAWAFPVTAARLRLMGFQHDRGGIMAQNDIVILSGARTAIGTFGGSLADVPPIQLAATVTRAAIERAGIAPERIGTVVFGHVLNTEPRDMYLSRVAMLEAGVPHTTPAMNVNRLCGSGAQAIVSAVQALTLGDADFAVAGGAETMSRA